jgi:hypothetical protein
MRKNAVRVRNGATLKLIKLPNCPIMMS